jgi:DNA-binding transcriptional LysR family regulator
MDHTFARTPHVRWLSAVSGEARVVMRTNSMLALIEAVRAGGGLGALPCALADRMPDLKRVLPDSAAVQRDLWLLYHRDLRNSRGVRAIVDTLVAGLRPRFAPPSVPSRVRA